MEKILVGVLMVVGAIVLVAVLSAVPVMFLWNALLPDLFGIQAIGFWQALGISTLCGLLFKNSTSSNSKK